MGLYICVSTFIILISSSLFWLIGPEKKCHAGSSVWIMGLAMFNIVWGVLELYWGNVKKKMILLASVVGTAVYIVLLFKKALPNEHVSWEAHIIGIATGFLAAFLLNIRARRRYQREQQILRSAEM